MPVTSRMRAGCGASVDCSRPAKATRQSAKTTGATRRLVPDTEFIRGNVCRRPRAAVKLRLTRHAVNWPIRGLPPSATWRRSGTCGWMRCDAAAARRPTVNEHLLPIHPSFQHRLAPGDDCARDLFTRPAQPIRGGANGGLRQLRRSGQPDFRSSRRRQTAQISGSQRGLTSAATARFSPFLHFELFRQCRALNRHFQFSFGVRVQTRLLRPALTVNLSPCLA